MIEFYSEHREITSELSQISSTDLVLLATDRWISNSLQQKAVRRGSVDLAQSAALTFFSSQKSAIWRRFNVVAFEDVGIADSKAIITTAICSDPAFRKTLRNDPALVVYLAGLLAKVPKSRSGEHLITSAICHPRFEQYRAWVSTAPTRDNLGVVADRAAPLHHRALAAWCAAGVGWRLPRASAPDLPGLLEVFESSGVPRTVARAAGLALRQSREAITLMVPVLWSHAAMSKKLVGRSTPQSVLIGEVPSYALDKHTRVGRQAIRMLVRANGAVAACLELYAGRADRNAAAYMAAFYTDAVPLNYRLEWDGSDDLEAIGMEADFLKVGVPAEGITPLLTVFADSLDQLNELRLHISRNQAGSRG